MSGGAEPADEDFWAGLRARYEGGTEKVADISREIGLSALQLAAKARKLGWTLRGSPKAREAKTGDTIGRLKALLQRRLTDLEGHIGAIGAAANATNSERGIRALNGLVRTLEKVMELERKDRTRRTRERKQFRALDDAERQALAGKLDGLRREHGSQADAPPAEQSGGGGAQP